jgi:hypothetical protein
VINRKTAIMIMDEQFRRVLDAAGLLHAAMVEQAL